MKNNMKKIMIGILSFILLFIAQNVFAASFWNQISTYPQPVYCTILDFTVNPTSVTVGDFSVLRWDTSNCNNITISNLNYISYNIPPLGTQLFYPTQTTTYILTAHSLTGATQTRIATVYVNDVVHNCSITNFTASDTSIEDGDYTTLRWNTNNCDRVKISNIGNVADDGSKTIYPSEDTTYVLTAYDSNDSYKTESVRIYVDENNNPDCSIDRFTTSNTYINSGDPATLRWSTSGCDNVSISNIGNVSLDGSKIIYPSSTTTYVLRGADGSNSSELRSIQVNVSYNQILPVQIYNTNVVTIVATNISQTGAQVNGLITSLNYSNENTYFEYGTTINLGIKTASRMTSSNTNFSEYLTNLSPNTIYFFQAFSEGSNGISRGAIEVFQTLGDTTTNNNVQTIKKVVVQGTTVSNSKSPIMLKIENRYQTIGIGDIIDYVVSYKNINSSKLTNSMVQVFIPKGITLINTSRGTYSESDRTLSASIEDLTHDAEGVIYLQAKVDSIDSNLAQIVTTAVLVYTNPNGAQENAMAYVLNNPKVVNLLGASVFFGNMFGLSLIDCLLLIIFILLLILIARFLYGRRNIITPTHTTIN